MKYSILIFAVLLFSIEAFSQPKEILEIRRLYQETQEQLPGYSKLSKDDFENSSEGGHVTAFKDDKEIRLIRATYYGHMGRSETDYYYYDNKIYFIYKKLFNYNMPPTESGFDSLKTVIEESRFYFWNDKMIRWIKPDGKYADKESTEFAQKARAQYDWAYELNGTIIK